ncbi:MAG: NEAT domain-containing protein [Clostridia bacterium]|nr:NEAT domain-containing protein [Clostridia bacterium]
MSKKLSVILSVFVLTVVLLCTSMSAFAMGPSKNGVYEVSIEMWHAEKERTSMGESYIVHTALLTVDGDEKTLTIAPKETSSDMQFWYYKDGSTEGDTVEVEQKNNVEIDGEKYDVAFEFPIKSDNEFVGVKFAASAMPLSPSARIKIDYDSAKRIGDVKKETTTKETTTVATTVTTTAAPESTTEQAEEAQESKGANKGVIIAGVVAVVVVVGVVVIVIKKKSN